MSFFPLPNKIGSKAFLAASFSSICAMLLGSIAGLPLFMIPYTPKSAWFLASLKIFDAFALQILATIHCYFCLIWWGLDGDSNGKKSWKQVVKRVGPPIITLIILTVVYYLINDLAFKKSFDRPRPSEELRSNIGFISRYIEPSIGGAPSGYAARGVFFLLTSVLAGIGIRESGKGVFRIISDVKIIMGIQVVLLLLTCCARVFTGYHFWFDILLGLSLGTFIYWIMTFLISTFAGEFNSEDIESLNTLLVSIIICFTIIGFFYSRDAAAWAPSVIITTFVSLLIQIRARRHKKFNPIDMKTSEGEVELK